MSEQNQSSPEPTKQEYFREGGVSYWRMSDGSTILADTVKVPLTDTIKRPPNPGFEHSALLRGVIDHRATAEMADEAAQTLRSGKLGEGDRSERLARVMDETAELERGAYAQHELELERRHGDSYQSPK